MHLRIDEILKQKGKTRYWLYIQPGLSYQKFKRKAENETKAIKFEKAVDFVMIKISAIDFNGTASVFTPKLICSDNKYIDDFEFAPEKLGQQKWIGEGFSHTERPSFSVKVNGQEIFNGRKTDRLHRLAGVEFKIPYGVIKDKNDIEITYLSDNKVSYAISELQLLTLPNELEILGVQKYQNKNKAFGVFCHKENGTELIVNADKDIEFIENIKIDDNYCVLKFLAEAVGANKNINIPVINFTLLNNLLFILILL